MKFIGLGKVSRQLFPIASIAINSILIGVMSNLAISQLPFRLSFRQHWA